MKNVDLKKLIEKTGLLKMYVADKMHISKSMLTRVINGEIKANVRGKRHVRTELTEWLIDYCKKQGIEYTDCMNGISENERIDKMNVSPELKEFLKEEI